MKHTWSTPGPDASAGSETTSVREFLRTETAGAVVLVLGGLAALVWANVAPEGYEYFWHTPLSVRVGPHGITLTSRAWINSGLMTLFFFVVGLESRREFDMGELRERKRLVLPFAAAVGAMALSVLGYLAVTRGTTAVHGWGVAMSTDTALALGILGTISSRMPPRLRIFVLTIAVVDDFFSIGVIAVAYSTSVSWTALAAGVLALAVLLGLRGLGVRRGAVYLGLACVAWVAFLRSGVDPVVVGLLMGMLTYAYPAGRSDLSRATELFRDFRQQPTPEMERSVRLGIASVISPNDRLQRLFHPWASFVIVPLFALANAGVSIDAHQLALASTSPITWGILLGYGLGKPAGVLLASFLVIRLSRGRMRTLVGWVALGAGGGLAAVGFTVSLLLATLAFHGRQLAEAKIGILCTIPCSFVLSWAVTWVVSLLPRPRRMKYLIGRAETIIDLQVPVDPARDHIKGSGDALVTVVVYGDYECPHCVEAESVIRRLMTDSDDLRDVWRHLPLTDVHPHAQLAAQAAEIAGAAGCFWEMHDLLLSRRGALRTGDLPRYAARLGIDAADFSRALRGREGVARVAEDVASADLSGVVGTPTFFINGRRFYGVHTPAALSTAVRAAADRAVVKRAASGLAGGR
ncbi:Na+/H+ antiporter NhaA [Streptomyces sp. NPDC005498]|uniref:Na+/H+ antiporter NhaA n=1 Tax=Streptomyces sp. NPDC005498 TaxID=3364717 RepID=UPI0036D1A154